MFKPDAGPQPSEELGDRAKPPRLGAVACVAEEGFTLDGSDSAPVARAIADALR